MTDLSVKLAAALLLKRGELSISDIDAIPSVEDEISAQAVANRLMQLFDVDIEQRQVDGAQLEWEQVLLLRLPALVRGSHAPTIPRQPMGELQKAAEDSFTWDDFEAALKKASRKVKASEPDTDPV